MAYGGKLLDDGVLLIPGSEGEGKGEGISLGLGGAIIPWEVSLRGRGRRRGIDSIGRMSNNDLKSDVL